MLQETHGVLGREFLGAPIAWGPNLVPAAAILVVGWFAARLVTSVMARGFMAGLQADPSSWASTTGAATSNPLEETRHEWAEP